VEMTSCGPNGGALIGKGEYPAYIACHIFDKERRMITGAPNAAYITQDGKDGDEFEGHIANIHDGTMIGFKYFDFEDVKKITLSIRGYGWGGKIQVKTEKYGEALTQIDLHNTNIWYDYVSDIALPGGVHSLYLTYTGSGSVMLKSVKFD
ncbi:MAG: carbohydrate-binding protein, partial [Clostridia bacterium]|nr:carbohydrate-binding protein [Clostridia bacterium]